MASRKAVLAWHFVKQDGTINRLGVKAEVGLVLKHPVGKLKICAAGLHASRQPLDALEYSPDSSTVISRVICKGTVVEPEGDNKLVCSVREILAVKDVSNVLHRFACAVASDALDAHEVRGRKVDPRSRRAIQAKLDWIAGGISDADLAAAWAAARDAAWAAAGDAWAAAWAAAGAAWAAARAAAGAAAWAAAGAAWAAARAAFNDLLASMLIKDLGLTGLDVAFAYDEWREAYLKPQPAKARAVNA